MRVASTLAKIAVTLSAVGFLVQWPVKGQAFYAAFIALGSATDIALVPFALRTRIGQVAVSVLVIAGLSCLTAAFRNGLVLA